MAQDDNSNGTSNRGLGSPNISEQKKHEIQSKGGKASGSSGAAGRTEAAARGGRNSRRSS